MTKKILCILLVVIILIPLTVSCKKRNTTGDNGVGTSANKADTVAGDHLEKRDYGGKIFRILSREDTKYEFEGNSTGSIVEQKTLERNLTIQDRFNVSIEMITRPGAWSNQQTFITYVQNNIMSGADSDSQINMVSTHAGYIGSMVLSGYATDLRELPNLDLTREWWEPNFYNNASINDKTYFAIGDINLTLYERIEVVLFNKELAESHGIQDLYATALDGKWTFATLYQIAKDFGGSKVSGEELYAVAMNCHATRSLVNSWNISYTQKNGDTGRYELYLSGNQKLYDGYNRFYNLMYGTVSHNPFTDSSELGTQAPMFAKNQVLFWFQYLQATDELKKLNMSTEYGILPYPLWDEAQYDSVGYISSVADNHNGIFVPSNLTQDDYDMTGMIIEALCMYSRSSVVDAYYEQNIKYRTVLDPRVVQVLDIVRQGLRFTFAQAWSGELNYVYSYYSRAWNNANYNGGVPDRELTTQINKLESSQKKLLENLYESYDALLTAKQ